VQRGWRWWALTPGHQWEVRLGRRQEDSVDRFPIDAEWSEFLCGATLRPRATIPDDLGAMSLGRTGAREGTVDDEIIVDFRPPRLSGPLADLAACRRPGVLAGRGPHDRRLAGTSPLTSSGDEEQPVAGTERWRRDRRDRQGRVRTSSWSPDAAGTDQPRGTVRQ